MSPDDFLKQRLGQGKAPEAAPKAAASPEPAAPMGPTVLNPGPQTLGQMGVFEKPPQYSWNDFLMAHLANWGKQLGQMGQTADDAVRSIDRAMTGGAADWLIGGGKALATGQSPQASIAQERALTDAARERLGPEGRLATDIAGWQMGPRFIPGGPLVQGPLVGGAQGYFTGQGGAGGGGTPQDIATGAGWGAAGGIAAKAAEAVADPLARLVRRATTDPSQVVYPYAGRTDVSGPTLGGVPGIYGGSRLGPATAADIASLARDMEAAAQGEQGGISSPGMQSIVRRINNVAAQGTPQGGTPGAGLNAVRQAYWEQGGPPISAATPEGGLWNRAAEIVGGGIGGAAGHAVEHATGLPFGARELGVMGGSKLAPWLLNRFGGQTAESAYPALAGGLQGLPSGAGDALTALILGGQPEYRGMVPDYRTLISP